MIDDLRSTLARHADEVVPLADPVGRLLVRRRRHRRTVTIGMAVAAVGALVPVGVLAADGWRVHNRHLPLLVQALLNSPIRGSLGNDTPFLTALRQRVASAGPVHRTPAAGASSPTGPVEPTGQSGQDGPIDPATVVVLFAGEITSNQRIAVVAFPKRRKAQLWVGPAGSPARNLNYRNECDLDPVLHLDVAEYPVNDGPAGWVGATLVLAPARTQLSYSGNPRYLADGTVTREWSRTPLDYLVRNLTEIRRRDRVRVEKDGVVLYEARMSNDGVSEESVRGTVNPTPRVGRPQPEMTRNAAVMLAGQADLDGATTVYQVLWTSTIPGAGSGNSDVLFMAIFGRTPDGGGVYGVYLHSLSTDHADLPGGPGHQFVIGFGQDALGVLGDPARSLIAVRLPVSQPNWPSDRLYVIAPPAAVRAEIVSVGGSVASGPLQDGVGYFSVPVGLQVTIRAYDAAGQQVATREFADSEAGDEDRLQPTFRGW